MRKCALILGLAALCGLSGLAAACSRAVSEGKATSSLRQNTDLLHLTFPVERFSAIEVEAPVQVVYTPGAGRARVSADVSAGWRDLLKVRVADGVLRISLDQPEHGKRDIPGDLRVTVEGPDVRRLKLGPAASLRATQSIGSDELCLDLEAATRLEMPAFDGRRLSLSAAGAAHVGVGPLDVDELTLDLGPAARLEVNGTVRTENGSLKAGAASSVIIEGDWQGGRCSWDVGAASNLTVDGTLRTADFSPELSAAARWKLGALECTRLSVKGMSAAAFSVGSTQADAVDVEAVSASQLNFGQLECGSLTVKASGTSQVKASGTCRGNCLLETVSAGNIRLKDWTAAGLEASASGISSIKVSGSTRGDARYEASGTSRISAEDFSARNVQAVARSSSVIRCCPSGRLTATCERMSNVYYAGRPASLQLAGERDEVRPL